MTGKEFSEHIQETVVLFFTARLACYLQNDLGSMKWISVISSLTESTSTRHISTLLNSPHCHKSKLPISKQGAVFHLWRKAQNVSVHERVYNANYFPL